MEGHVAKPCLLNSIAGDKKLTTNVIMPWAATLPRMLLCEFMGVIMLA